MMGFAEKRAFNLQKVSSKVNEPASRLFPLASKRRWKELCLTFSSILSMFMVHSLGLTPLSISTPFHSTYHEKEDRTHC
jgi:hypothetical protein